MPPDFNQKTIINIAKRVAFICSNPDCKVTTVGPNSAPDKATTIGEAAHIYGARPKTARYEEHMSDAARAEVTNGIWLCRNCHKIVDRDPKIYSVELLFEWREQHEKYVAAELGSPSDRDRFNLEESHLQQFSGYPPIIRRIAMDQPIGWEWRLTAELMRHLNRPHFRRLQDLRNNLYTRPLEHIEDEYVIKWIGDRIGEMSVLISPIANLLDRLNDSWGAPGEKGDIDEIHHICCLIRDSLAQVIEHEERARFVRVSEEFEKLVTLIRDCLGDQVDKLANIPDSLDEIVSLIGTDHGGTIKAPLIINKTIDFELPDGWEKQMSRELRRAEKRLSPGSAIGDFVYGFFGLIALIWFLVSVLF